MRLVFEIRKTGTGWTLFNGKTPIYVARSKQLVIEYASDELGILWQVMRIPSELRIKDRRGVIRDCRTYGLDPRRIKG